MTILCQSVTLLARLFVAAVCVATPAFFVGAILAHLFVHPHTPLYYDPWAHVF